MADEIFGKLGIISMPGCDTLSGKVDTYLTEWREAEEDTFVIPSVCPRFGSGEAKALIKHTVRGYIPQGRNGRSDESRRSFPGY